MVYSNEVALAIGTQGWTLTLVAGIPSINPSLTDNIPLSGKLTDATGTPLGGQQIDVFMRGILSTGGPVKSIWDSFVNSVLTATDGTYTMSIPPSAYTQELSPTLTTARIDFITGSGEVAPPPSLLYTSLGLPIGATTPADSFIALGLVGGVVGFLLLKESWRSKHRRRDNWW